MGKNLEKLADKWLKRGKKKPKKKHFNKMRLARGEIRQKESPEFKKLKRERAAQFNHFFSIK